MLQLKTMTLPSTVGGGYIIMYMEETSTCGFVCSQVIAKKRTTKTRKLLFYISDLGIDSS